MRMKWVLVGFAILYLVVALAFLPSEIWRSSPIEDLWEILTGVVYASMTIISVGLMEAMTPLARPLARAVDMRVAYVEEGLFALICVVVAVFSAVQLLRRDLTPGRYGTYTFLLLFALSLVAMVRFTMYSWSHFA
jgi:hypothetical protein